MRKGAPRREVPAAPTPAPDTGGHAGVPHRGDRPRGSFLGELRRRNVIRVAGLYLVGGWLIVQVAETLLPVFGTPDWVLKSVIVLLALAFIPALVFSWVYELTPEGLRRETDVPRDASIVGATARRLDIATMLLLAAVAGLVVWQQTQAPPAAGVAATGSADAATGGAAAADGADTGRADAGNAASPVSAASIAVLPFVNLSGDAANEYFSDGVTEEILNALTRIEGLKVAGRTSSFRFKGRNEDLKAIGAALGVAHVLEGSVRKQGDHVRITAQLIKVEDGFHVWSQNFDRELVDIFAVQDEISVAIATALSSRIMGAAAGAVPAGGGTDAATYDTYLRARQELASRDAARIQNAADLFAEVVAQTPDFDAAWSGRAKALALVFNYAGGVADPMRYAEATAAADRALALNPANAEALVIRGLIAAIALRDVDALADARAAFAAAPNDAEVANFAGDIGRLTGELDDGLRWEQRAAELDPLFAVHHSDLGYLLTMRRRYAEAVASGERALRMDPGYWTAHDMRARAFLGLGDVDAAAAELDRIAAMNPTFYLVTEMRARIALARGDVAGARRHLGELQARAAAGETLHFVIATLQARLGDTADAATSLQRAIDARDPAISGDVEWIRASDWPDDPAIRQQLARPEIAAIYARRARFAGDGPSAAPTGVAP